MSRRKKKRAIKPAKPKAYVPARLRPTSLGQGVKLMIAGVPVTATLSIEQKAEAIKRRLGMPLR